MIYEVPTRLYAFVNTSIRETKKYHEEDLLQPLDTVLIPAGVDVHAARLTAYQVLS